MIPSVYLTFFYLFSADGRILLIITNVNKAGMLDSCQPVMPGNWCSKLACTGMTPEALAGGDCSEGDSVSADSKPAQ
ncbi:hypothetical protein ACFFJN_15960 [Erwinia mallotivora]|uniref:hypothetical protein n=1 Tax=Erwinia mallotivora TaxID=69222 RepID=UPI0035EBCDDA